MRAGLPGLQCVKTALRYEQHGEPLWLLTDAGDKTTGVLVLVVDIDRNFQIPAIRPLFVEGSLNNDDMKSKAAYFSDLLLAERFALADRETVKGRFLDKTRDLQTAFMEAKRKTNYFLAEMELS